MDAPNLHQEKLRIKFKLKTLVIMKTIIFALAVFLTTNTFAGGDEPIKDELSSKLILDLSDVQFSPDNFVMVNFNVVDKQIVINNIFGNNEVLTEKVSSKLSRIELEEYCPEGKEHLFKFTFLEE